MESLYVRDFDFGIEDVLLAHKYYYGVGVDFSGYMKGRTVSGLVYCISGEALYRFGSMEVVLHPGELIFLPASASYSVACLGDEAFCHITVNFNIPAEELKLLIPGKYDEIANEMVIADTSDIKELMERLLLTWNHKNRGYRVMAKALVYELTYKYFVLLGKKHHSDAYNKIKPAKRLLDEQYTKNIPVAELAALCGFSETHFRRLFSQIFHCSPTEYRLNKRILQAKDLLLTDEFSIAEVAEIVGFEDANYFSRIFKAHTGVTPSAYSIKGTDQVTNQVT